LYTKQATKVNVVNNQTTMIIAIKTALTTELRFKIGPVKVKTYVLRISC